MALAAVEKLTGEIQEALGADLVSLLLYGSSARGNAVPNRSDVNVLLIVREASAETLHRMAPALNAWARAGHRLPLIHTLAEWRDAADVFPMEIEDIRDAHHVLAGSDPLDGLATTRADLRRELEREARGKLLYLRAGYTAASGDGAALGELLAQALGTLLVLFRAALRACGRSVPGDTADLIRRTADEAGFDAAAFDWALAARQGAAPRRLAPYDPDAARYLAAVERFTRWVNDLPTQG
jgi:predicted nucleotidyltransferase